jgi:hypothetical protein
MLIRSSLILALTLLPALPAFADHQQKNIHYSFETGSDKWRGDFTDYPQGQEQFYELSWGWENLPANQMTYPNQTLFTKGIYLAGNNHSDDLFMYIKAPVSGLKPNTAYRVTLTVNLATNIPEGLSGIGGSPGESVTLKIGASTIEPEKVNHNGFYVLNVDKGNQENGGKNAVVVGNLANPLVDQRHPQFAIKQVNNLNNPIIVNADANGQVWVFLGTDSGFEGLSKYYIGDVNITLQEVEARN